MRKSPRWPRRWASVSLLQLHSHRTIPCGPARIVWAGLTPRSPKAAEDQGVLQNNQKVVADKLAAETAAYQRVRCELEAAEFEAAELRRRVEQVSYPSLNTPHSTPY